MVQNSCIDSSNAIMKMTDSTRKQMQITGDAQRVEPRNSLHSYKDAPAFQR